MSVAPNTSTQKLGTPAEEEDRIEKQLLADGVLDQLPLPVADEAAYRRWQPIPWEGTPVSQTILEERR